MYLRNGFANTYVSLANVFPYLHILTQDATANSIFIVREINE